MRRTTALGVLAAAAALAAAVAGSASGPAAARPEAKAASSLTVRIWADRDRTPAVTRVAQAWAQRRGLRVEVVTQEFDKIRDNLKTVRPENAPDVIVAAHDWTGQLAADGSVRPITPRRTLRNQIPGYALSAFSYGRATTRLYGAPVALENIGLVVNTQLARVPRSFADLQRQALAFKRRGSNRVAISVPQGSGGDAYHMYPFFSGLCGYVFGRTRSGGLNPRDIGLDAPRFLRNSTMIDQWNRSGLINSKIGYDQAKTAFLERRAAFWITGPWESDTLKRSGIRFRIVQIPQIRCRSVPFLGVQGFMVTKFAAQHRVELAAKDLVGNYMMQSGPQQQLAAANGRYPANVRAGRAVRDNVLRQFGAAGRGGVPMPNIPQMASVWTELGGAWVKSTQGSGSTRARTAFLTAARNIANKIG